MSAYQACALTYLFVWGSCRPVERSGNKVKDLSRFTGLSLLYVKVTVMNNYCFESYVFVVGLAVLLLCFEIFAANSW